MLTPIKPEVCPFFDNGGRSSLSHWAFEDNGRILKKRTHTLPEVNFSDEGKLRHLHLGTEWIQGSMLMDDPIVLFHEYIQRMMAWLLFVEPDTVPKRQAMQLLTPEGCMSVNLFGRASSFARKLSAWHVVAQASERQHSLGKKFQRSFSIRVSKYIKLNASDRAATRSIVTG